MSQTGLARPRPGWLRTLAPDPYVLTILLMVALATVFPVRGRAAADFSLLTKLAIGLLFFLLGARLARQTVLAAILHWRLHLAILAATFLLFPLLGLAAARLPESVLPPALATGIVFLCCLPSTVQSSIAFTSVARGNVAAAVVAASASNLLGIVVTPLLAALLVGTHAAGSQWAEVQAIVVQLLVPFAGGQVARTWIGGWVQKNARLVGYTDRGSILLVVYGAFSAAVVQGIWREVSLTQILWLLAICAAILAVALAATALGARALKFDKADEIAMVFCGSKKSLATGVPMAGILFPAASVGLVILPVMLFHQLQLMACAVLAQRYASRTGPG